MLSFFMRASVALVLTAVLVGCSGATGTPAPDSSGPPAIPVLPGDAIAGRSVKLELFRYNVDRSKQTPVFVRLAPGEDYDHINEILVGARIRWQGRPADATNPPPKMEVGFGTLADAEGAPLGWVDVTADAARWGAEPPAEPSLEQLSLFILLPSWSDSVRARVSCADGTVVYSRAEDEPRLSLRTIYQLFPGQRQIRMQLHSARANDGMTRSWDRVSGPATLTLLIEPIIEGYDFDERIGWLSVELDCGDGSGWRDVSAQMRAYERLRFDHSSDRLQLLPHHNYETPGSYELRSRVTYWDGQVQESLPFDVVITP